MRTGMPNFISVFFLASAFLIVHAVSGLAAEKDARPEVAVAGEKPGDPPSDAVVLFDGENMDAWSHRDGSVVKWTVENGYVQCKPKTGSIITREKHGDIQLHIEFATPHMPEAQSQDRGNSGVYLQSRYEVQILDSHGGETYPDGQCAAIYGQYPPLVNVCRPPGEWQTYDIIFHAPKFTVEGLRAEPGRITVFHNGVLVQNNVTLRKDTTASMLKEAPGDAPLYLQDHGNNVRYRNIWYRPLDAKK